MKKLRLLVLVVLFSTMLVLLPGMAKADDVSSPNFFKRIGSSVSFLKSTWELGSSSARVAKGWFTDVDISGTVNLGGSFGYGNLDLNGSKLTFDPDADTSLQADTDDQLDIEINGADDFTFTPNTFTALTGSSIVAPTVLATTIDTNVAAAGVTLSGTTLQADGTDTNIDINLTPKGSGKVAIMAGSSITGTNSGSGALFQVTDNVSSGYSNILSFFAPNAPSGALMTFGKSATRSSSWTWDDQGGTSNAYMAYQTYGNSFPFEFQGSYTRFAPTLGSIFLSGPSAGTPAGTEIGRFLNARRTFGVGTNGPLSTLHIAQPTTGPGTVSVAGDTVTGNGTTFINTFKAGDNIVVTTTSGTESKSIVSIASDTVMTTASFAGTAAAGTAYSLTGGDTLKAYGNGNTTLGTRGYVGVGTTDLDGTPAVGRLTVGGIDDSGTTNIISLRNYSSQNLVNINTLGDFNFVNSGLEIDGTNGNFTNIGNLVGKEGQALNVSVATGAATNADGSGILISADLGGNLTTGGDGGDIELRGGEARGTDPNVGGSIILRSGVGVTGTSLGATVLTDGEFDVWTNPTTLTNWTAIDAFGTNGTVDQESTIVYSGTSAVKLTNVGGDYKLIYQTVSGLTAGDLYRFEVYARGVTGTGEKAQLLYLDDDIASATEVYNTTTEAWVAWTGVPPVNEDITITASYAKYTALKDVPVPTSGKLSIVLVGDSDGVGNVVYLDKATLQKVTTVAGTNGSLVFLVGNDATLYVDMIPGTRTPALYNAGTSVDASSVAMVLGAKEAYTSGKLISVRNEIENAWGTEKFFIDYQGSYQGTGRQLGLQGSDVTAANDITLGLGNYYDITGATEMQRILGTGWTAGTMVTLQFDGAPLVKNATAAGTGYYGFKLAGGADFQASADDTLTLIFDGAWFREISRSAN